MYLRLTFIDGECNRDDLTGFPLSDGQDYDGIDTQGRVCYELHDKDLTDDQERFLQRVPNLATYDVI